MDCTVSGLDLVCLPDSSKCEQCVYTVICVCVCVYVCVPGPKHKHTDWAETALHPPTDQLQVNHNKNDSWVCYINDCCIYWRVCLLTCQLCYRC